MIKYLQQVKILFGVFMFVCVFQLGAKAQIISEYTVKENLLKNNKLAVIACDTAGVPTEKVRGNYLFVINGFEQNLRFVDGVAVVPQKIEKSSFVFFKHKNTSTNINQLYFVYKGDEGISPTKINVLWLLLVPVVIILVISTLKKYIWVGVILLIVYLFMGQKSGLSIGTFTDSLFSQLQSLLA